MNMEILDGFICSDGDWLMRVHSKLIFVFGREYNLDDNLSQQWILRTKFIYKEVYEI